ncbi:hypothetical protein HYFRA_00008820 [Hymenoscyphus fraxineus]|uniref:Uncharacterized protein n=1 Tax=Hymenoscyphus fraxineus TaxID=746836 RepID=A0A9N9KZN2_9HELO|nr:hypothetical protein HYFRA_00008820 [Hymenoscyphus fraxineus]
MNTDTNVKRGDSKRGRFMNAVKTGSFRQEPKPTGPQMVEDHQMYVDRGLCANCTLSQDLFDCGHTYNREATMCAVHNGLPLGLPGINVTPDVVRQQGLCEPCTLRSAEEAKLSNFLTIRGLSKKKWGKLENRGKELVTEMERARAMTEDQWIEFKTWKLAEIEENNRISSLKSDDAKAEEQSLRARIEHLTPRKRPAMAVRQVNP